MMAHGLRQALRTTRAPRRTATVMTAADGGGFATAAGTPRGNRFDEAAAGVYEQRERDWRNGAVVYQVLVDRFAPPANLESRRHLYPAPKVLRRWDETPRRGRYLPEAGLWSHEIEFWGGDLHGLADRLDHVQALGADVLYLNPVHLAGTNHKYDVFDHHRVAPEFGRREDLQALAQDLHGRGMRLVLDGVFNHMGRRAPVFMEAEAAYRAESTAVGGGRAAATGSAYRDWFVFGPQYPGGARCWWQVHNLPELNLEHPAVREHVYGGTGSVVRSHLREGADGWRLDVAADIGFQWLEELTRAAHAEKPGSLVVGEVANYPKEWFPALDGVINFTLRSIVLQAAACGMDAALAQRMIDRLVAECGTAPLLKSWLMLDNHDTARLASVLPGERQRRLAQVLQFTLPGAPCLYYGSEVGMTGGEDPEMRAPMRWDRVAADHPALAWTRQLVALRRAHRALRIGDYRPVTAQRLLAFERHTDRAADTVIVVANPGATEVTETLMPANSKLMDTQALVDRLGGRPRQTLRTGLLDITLPAGAFMLLTPELSPGGGYSPYKRVQ
jgi:glycosidase